MNASPQGTVLLTHSICDLTTAAVQRIRLAGYICSHKLNATKPIREGFLFCLTYAYRMITGLAGVGF